MQVQLTNEPREKQRLLQALNAFAEAEQLPAKVRYAADLALEEHVTNIMKYAYVDSRTHEILVRLEVVEGALQVEVEDDGKPFNPLEQPAPDVNLPLEKRPVGGLGIHLIRQFMDELGYRRKEDRNILTMRKQLAEKPA